MAIKDKSVLKVLITGGAGFMGRWVSKAFVEKGHKVWIFDNLSNCAQENIEEFGAKLCGFIKKDITERKALSGAFKNSFDICIHMAAAINVQESIDNPERCFNENIVGTFNVLEECRKHNVKMVFISSALVYDTAKKGEKISEEHPLNPSCPYTASKIFGEKAVISYHRTYALPTVILRPFSIYGPWQRSDSEGGVMSIFIDRALKGKIIDVFGNGRQGRDFFYVEDCADFILKAATSRKAIGKIFNAGSGSEVKIGDLAKKISGGAVKIRLVPHHHRHAEVMSMRADSFMAARLLNWKPKTTLQDGIRKTEEWLKSRK